MTWTPAGNFLLNQAIALRSTTKKHDLGTEVECKDPDSGAAIFAYQKGVASATAKNWVTINMDDGTVTRLVASGIGPVGVLMATLTASYYGWVQRTGKALASCLTLFADNANVWCTSTAGSVDDTSVAGDLVANAKGASLTVVGSAYAEFEIDRPFVDHHLSGS